MRLSNAPLNFLDLIIKGSLLLRDLKSLAHEWITNSHDSLSYLWAILKDYDVDSFVGKLAKLCNSLGIRVIRIVDDLLEEGKRLSASGSEKEPL